MLIYYFFQWVLFWQVPLLSPVSCFINVPIAEDILGEMAVIFVPTAESVWKDERINWTKD